MARIIGTEGTSIIFHCEDDSDTGPIFLSLGKLLLDPYYRTFQGFQNLIEEEWLAFGFRFGTRCGQLVCRSPPSLYCHLLRSIFTLFFFFFFFLSLFFHLPERSQIHWSQPAGTIFFPVSGLRVPAA